MHLKSYVIAVAIFFFLTSSFPTRLIAVTKRENTLIIGKVSDNPKKHIKRLQPIVDYAANKLSALGIKHGEVVFARNNREMIELLKTGQVDWVTESIYSALQFERHANAKIFLKRWKKGRPDYHSVFVSRRDNGITRLEHLKNKKLALEDLGSTTAYFLPVLALVQQNLPYIALPSPRVAAPEKEVGIIFAGGEVNIATWVHKGLADAGAFSNVDWDTEDHMPGALKKDLHIFYRSKTYPRMLELLAAHVSLPLQKKLTEVLLNAANDADAKTALIKYQKTTRFEELGEESLAVLEQARGKLATIEVQP